MTSSHRVSLAGQLGTVRYTGPVDGTSGIWLGIEWDDPNRGKHNGSKDGKQYFIWQATYRSPRAFSFIVWSSALKTQDLLFALPQMCRMYIETLHGSASPEQVVLGSSHGSILVEAVNLDKIRCKLANLSKLTQVSVDGLQVATCDNLGTIRDSCPSELRRDIVCSTNPQSQDIVGLDMSKNLLPNWDVVAQIARELPKLKRLSLNLNRLLPGTDPSLLKSAFLHLTELHLSGTMMSWSEMQTVTAVMPSLEVIEFGYNNLTSLLTTDSVVTANQTLRVLNLDSNACSNWLLISKAIRHYTCVKSLQRLVLTANAISAIPRPEGHQSLHSLKHLSLSYNKVHSWSDIDALSSWCPALETLTLTGNPLTSERYLRPFTISKIPTLEILDGAEEPASDNERLQVHPQWHNLCKKHGKPEETNQVRSYQNKLSQRLIGGVVANMTTTHAPNPAGPPLAQDEHLVLRVLPTMTLRLLRTKLCKTLRIKAQVRFWIQQDKTLAEIGDECNNQTLDWLGLDDRTTLVYSIDIQ
ncbi:hypothetical protein H0H93_011729 [Arthromyces matolae]|nr:hypothetical protein H0H93_011729 [Arthromyces matolae]